MKFFYWNLNEKEKLVRSFWFGLVAILLLALVVWKFIEDPLTAVIIVSILTVIYLIDISIKFRKYKMIKNNS